MTFPVVMGFIKGAFYSNLPKKQYWKSASTLCRISSRPGAVAEIYGFKAERIRASLDTVFTPGI